MKIKTINFDINKYLNDEELNLVSNSLLLRLENKRYILVTPKHKTNWFIYGNKEEEEVYKLNKKGLDNALKKLNIIRNNSKKEELDIEQPKVLKKIKEI